MPYLGPILYMVIIFALLYFLIIRPQKKRQKAQQDMMAGMQVGDHAVTIGGLHGEIAEINETANTITLDCEGIVLVFDRRAIARTEKTDPHGSKAANDVMSDAAEKQSKNAEANQQHPSEDDQNVEMYDDSVDSSDDLDK